MKSNSMNAAIAVAVSWAGATAGSASALLFRYLGRRRVPAGTMSRG